MTLFSCRDTTRLLSEALDRDLALGQRLTARLHLLFCGPCSRFRKHLRLLRDAARNLDDTAHRLEVRLSPAARNRILQALKEGRDRQ